MRADALNLVYELAREDDRVVFIGSDLGPGVLANMREEMPERFFMEGVNEAAIVGMAAGMAAEGRVVYVNTIAPFFTRRALEQIAMDVCLHNHDVRLIANGGGLVYAPLGPTHMAIEDLATMRLLPNMRVLAPADAPEMVRQMRALHGTKGPAYIRVAKGNEPDVTPEYAAEIGKPVLVRDGGDALVITTGVTLQTALAADTDAAILHCPWIKPFDFSALDAALVGRRAMVTVEEHVTTGGVGGLVAEWLCESRHAGVPFKRLGLPDEYPDQYGSQAGLMRHYGITPEAISAALEGLR